jgi:uncharacterized protein (DUF305 family)
MKDRSLSPFMKTVSVTFILLCAALAPPAKADSLVLDELSTSTFSGQQDATPETPDGRYLNLMITHHEQSLRMARLAQQRAQDAAVILFAKKVADEQVQEIQELQRYREKIGAREPAPPDPYFINPKDEERHAMMSRMGDDIDELRTAQGLDFDPAFLDAMKRHHKISIDLSKEAAEKASDGDIRGFAQKSIDKQTLEIEEMNKIKGAPGIP